MSDTVTFKLCSPRGWLCIARLGPRKWGWEARSGYCLVDAGIERTKRAALKAAERAVAERNFA